MVADKNEVIGLDVGHKRIGVARVSLIAKLPEAIKIIENNEDAFKEIEALCEQQRSNQVVVGLPHSMSGGQTEQSEFSKKFASGLKDHLGAAYTVTLVDESLSSVKAKERFPEKKHIDDVAAAIILEHFLEEHVS